MRMSPGLSLRLSYRSRPSVMIIHWQLCIMSLNVLSDAIWMVSCSNGLCSKESVWMSGDWWDWYVGFNVSGGKDCWAERTAVASPVITSRVIKSPIVFGLWMICRFSFQDHRVWIWEVVLYLVLMGVRLHFPVVVVERHCCWVTSCLWHRQSKQMLQQGSLKISCLISTGLFEGILALYPLYLLKNTIPSIESWVKKLKDKKEGEKWWRVKLSWHTLG